MWPSPAPRTWSAGTKCGCPKTVSREGSLLWAACLPIQQEKGWCQTEAQAGGGAEDRERSGPLVRGGVRQRACYPHPSVCLGLLLPHPLNCLRPHRTAQHGVWCSRLSETPQDHPVWDVVLQVMPWLPSPLSLGPLICISNEPPSPISPHILIRHFTWKE